MANTKKVNRKQPRSQLHSLVSAAAWHERLTELRRQCDERPNWYDVPNRHFKDGALIAAEIDRLERLRIGNGAKHPNDQAQRSSPARKD